MDNPMRKKKKNHSSESKREYLSSVGYQQIEVAELIDIMFTINGRNAHRPLVNNINFETTQVNYNG